MESFEDFRNFEYGDPVRDLDTRFDDLEQWRTVSSVRPEDFEKAVFELLYRTDYKRDKNDEDRMKRAYRYNECSARWMAKKCSNCGWRGNKWLITCNLRGCRKCSKGLRKRLIDRYLPRLSKFSTFDMRHIVFTFARVPAEMMQAESGWLLKRVMYLCRKMFAGGIVSAECNSKDKGEWYLHVHALVLRFAGERFDYQVINAGWRQLAGSYVKVKEVDDLPGKLDYIAGYVLKKYSEQEMNAGEYVDLMMSLQGKRIVRAFGCLYGRRKGASGKPIGGDVKQAGEERAGAPSRSLEKDSTKFVEHVLVCPVCSSDSVELISGFVGIADEELSASENSSSSGSMNQRFVPKGMINQLEYGKWN